MRYFWSASKAGFFSPEIHGDAMPSDCIEIREAEYRALIDKQAQGERIQAGANGRPESIPAGMLPITAPEVKSRFTARVQREIDSLAASWGYDSVLSAATYAASSIAQFRAEAMALLAYRDAMWAWASSQGQPTGMSIAEYSARVEIMMQSAPAKPARPTV